MENLVGSLKRKTSMVIATTNRAEVLHDTIVSALSQAMLPVEIIVVPARATDVLDVTLGLPLVRSVPSSPGLTKQRNAGIAHVDPSAEYVAFVDDDIEFHNGYIFEMQRFFDEDLNIVVANAATIANGVGLGGLTREFAKARVAEFVPSDAREDGRTAYGCNMFVRRSVLDHVRFDEQLPMYSMMEDTDFSVQCGRHGTVCRTFRTGIVHLATSGGRMNERRAGYSQIANSYHLWRKQSMSTSECFIQCWARFLIGNGLRFRIQKPVSYGDRFRGNIIALKDFFMGQMRPERATNL